MMGILVYSNKGQRHFPREWGEGYKFLTKMHLFHGFAQVLLLLGNCSQGSDVTHGAFAYKMILSIKN